MTLLRPLSGLSAARRTFPQGRGWRVGPRPSRDAPVPVVGIAVALNSAGLGAEKELKWDHEGPATIASRGCALTLP